MLENDGAGFDLVSLERAPRRKGVGLLSMRKRIELLSGRFYLTSKSGRGTQVHVEVPLPLEEGVV